MPQCKSDVRLPVLQLNKAGGHRECEAVTSCIGPRNDAVHEAESSRIASHSRDKKQKEGQLSGPELLPGAVVGVKDAGRLCCSELT